MNKEAKNQRKIGEIQMVSGVRQEAGGSVRVLAIERTGQKPIPSAGAV